MIENAKTYECHANEQHNADNNLQHEQRDLRRSQRLIGRIVQSSERAARIDEQRHFDVHSDYRTSNVFQQLDEETDD